MASTDSVDVREPRTPSSTTSFTPGSQGAAKGHWWVWVLLLVIVVGGYWYYKGRNSQADAAAAGGKGPGGAAMGAPGSFVVPVVVATATKGDLPVFLNGLGNVAAFNTVTVRSRVDGQIVKINFVEGQNVAIDYRWAENNVNRMPALAKELLILQPDVVFAGATQAVSFFA